MGAPGGSDGSRLPGDLHRASTGVCRTERSGRSQTRHEIINGDFDLFQGSKSLLSCPAFASRSTPALFELEVGRRKGLAGGILLLDRSTKPLLLSVLVPERLGKEGSEKTFPIGICWGSELGPPF